MSYVKKTIGGGGQIDPPPPSRNRVKNYLYDCQILQAEMRKGGNEEMNLRLNIAEHRFKGEGSTFSLLGKLSFISRNRI